ncbi:MAG: Uncharacterized protein FD161_2045 [Limisphaerales bacterium]|nr:MAG: Uncharacterized protein FD161_2045 [Limisphaerales bacterium]KAG0508950.1 MAG: Uncharacterized protein E1N63_1847 [Limisphaerales bacterium]TXT51329.1 MAG: Uncharacterized protein FD140_1788 [Limisphaerales bacterium]
MKTLLHCPPLFAVLLVAGAVFAQEKPASLLPVFGAEGREFTAKAQGGKAIKGWLPTGWDDNSEWATLAATYTKLKDGPKEGVTAVRIELKDLGEGQLQLTSYSGKRVFKKGVKHVIEGWLRGSAEFKVGVRQPGDPYEFYVEHELSGGKEWKAFKAEFALEADKEAFIMFVMPGTGTVDLAGVVVREVK